MEYKIGDLAAMVGLPVHVVRFYEKYGIVSPKRTGDGKYRTFEEMDLRRLTLARYFRGFGFPLEQTAELISNRSYDQQYTALGQRAQEIRTEIQRLEQLEQAIHAELSAMDFAQAALDSCLEITLPGIYWLFSHTEKRDFAAREVDDGLTARVMQNIPHPCFHALVEVDRLQAEMGPFSYRWGISFDERYREYLGPEDLSRLLYLPSQRYLAFSSLVDNSCILTREMFRPQLARCAELGLRPGTTAIADLQMGGFRGQDMAPVVCFLPIESGEK